MPNSTAAASPAMVANRRAPARIAARILSISIVPAPTVTNVLIRLEKRGLVARTTVASGRRVRRVSLTADGRTILLQMADAADRAHARTIDAVPTAEREVFIAAQDISGVSVIVHYVRKESLADVMLPGCDVRRNCITSP
jgi:DNA-binding MarR family transcriptional regulator